MPSAGTTTYDRDLNELREHLDPTYFRAFARRHAGIVKRIAGPWHRRCPDKVDLDDVCQEVLESIWRAVDTWDASRGVGLPQWVRQSIRFRCLKLTTRLIQARHVEARHVELFGRRDDAVCDESSVGTEEAVRYSRRSMVLVGSFADRRDAAFISRVVRGQAASVARAEVYVRSTAGGQVRKARRALNRAISIAQQLE